jgi:hypothetical protein
MQGQPITGDTMLPDLIRRFPSARGVLDRYGLRGCGGPEGPRETVAWFRAYTASAWSNYCES